MKWRTYYKGPLDQIKLRSWSWGAQELELRSTGAEWSCAGNAQEQR